MKPAQIWIAFLVGIMAATGSARAQVARQALNFAIFGQYQENEIFTNAALTNEEQHIQTVEFSTRDMLKALALDYAGTNWLTLMNTMLVRETEFTNGLSGREGMFLYRYYPPTNINVSTNFGLNFTNDFREEVAGVFPGVTNLDVNASVSGGTFPTGATNTNTLVSAGLFAVNFYTTNLQCNLVGYGTTTEATFTGFQAGVKSSGPVEKLQVLAGVGTVGINIGTNFFVPSIVGNPNTNFASGPGHGFFGTEEPIFITNSAAAVFP